MKTFAHMIMGLVCIMIIAYVLRYSFFFFKLVLCDKSIGEIIYCTKAIEIFFWPMSVDF